MIAPLSMQGAKRRSDLTRAIAWSLRSNKLRRWGIVCDGQPKRRGGDILYSARVGRQASGTSQETPITPSLGGGAKRRGPTPKTAPQPPSASRSGNIRSSCGCLMRSGTTAGLAQRATTVSLTPLAACRRYVALQRPHGATCGGISTPSRRSRCHRPSRGTCPAPSSPYEHAQ